MKGARINFGVPNSEYVLLADDDGVAVSLKNQDTNTEYIGGGSGGDWTEAELTVTFDGTTSYNLYANNIIHKSDDFAEISQDIINEVAGVYPMLLYKNKNYIDDEDSLITSSSGNIEFDSDSGKYIITGDCSITVKQMSF